jgi:CRISPR-associated endonuclease/helicase Cas3
LQRVFEIVARCHDLGKAAEIWQIAAGNETLAPAVAKSGPTGMKPRRLNGYRHEFGSLVNAVPLLDHDDDDDLVLHVIAVHHGRGRPHFDRRALAHHPGLDVALLPAEIA